MLHYHYCKARLLEIPMHLQYNLRGLVPPFVSRLPQNATRPIWTQDQGPNKLTSEIHNYIDACHDLLDTFLATLPQILAQQPNVTFVRALYAVKALLELEELLISNTQTSSRLGDRLRISHFKARIRDHINQVYRDQNWTTAPLPLRMLDQITRLYLATIAKARSDPDYAVNVSNTPEFAIPMDNSWNQRQEQINLPISTSMDPLPSVPYTMDLDDDTARWLSAPISGIGNEFWDMEYFPINI